MKKVIVSLAILAVMLVGCREAGEVTPNTNDNIYTWSYVTGPNGENCLVAQRFVGWDTGVAMMDCDHVGSE